MPAHTARPEETGSVTVFFAVTALGLFAVFGLVLDAGRALTAKADDTSQAFAAARAGAEQIAPAALRSGTPSLDPPAAVDAAQAVLAADRLAGQVTVTGLAVTVAVTQTVPTEVLGLIGITSITVHGTATATATPGP